MKIPARFELQGRTIRVVLSKNRLMAETWAQWESGKDLITIDPEAPKDMQTHSFLHEFLHAALEACGREDLSIDERFVDQLAGLVHQLLKTSRA